MEGTWETSVLLAAQLVGMSIMAQLWLQFCAPGILEVNEKRKEGVLGVSVNSATIRRAGTHATKVCAMKFRRPNYCHSIAGHSGHVVLRRGTSFSRDGSLASVRWFLDVNAGSLHLP